MPLLLDPTPSADFVEGRLVRLEGLPDFNTEGQYTYVINQFDGFFSTAAPVPVLVSNGGGAGTLAIGTWAPAEAAYLLVGRIHGPKDFLAACRRLLLAALPADREATVVFPGSGWDVDLQIFVRRYDKPDIDIHAYLEFSFPLVAPDPYKYALEPVTGTMGVWTGEEWFLPLTFTGGVWTMLLTLDGTWGLELEQTAPTGPYPESVTITSPGDATSQRVTFTISGPLTAGDWWLYEESTGNRLWIEAGVVAGQTAVLDCAARTATVAGVDATHLVYGDWFTLQPGANTYQLVAGTASEAFAVVSALPAYQ